MKYGLKAIRAVVPLVVPTVLCVEASCRGEPPPAAENLVLVTIDTLRADRLGIYGGEVATPNLDRIGREGAYARNALSVRQRDQASHLSKRRLTFGVSFVRLKRSPVLRMASAWVG